MRIKKTDIGTSKDTHAEQPSDDSKAIRGVILSGVTMESEPTEMVNSGRTIALRVLTFAPHAGAWWDRMRGGEGCNVEIRFTDKPDWYGTVDN